MIKKNKEIVLRKVGQFYFLIDPRVSYNSDDEDIFQTDEIGAAMWNCIDEETDFTTVYESFIKLLNDELTPELRRQIDSDLRDYLNQLKVNLFITEV